MNTSLVELNDFDGNKLRGILTEPEQPEPSAVIMMSGFERAASTEKKFKFLADRLGELGVSCLRLDAAGIGLSDGDYGLLSVEAMSAGMSAAAEWMRDRGYPTVSAAAHSLGACVVASSWNEATWNRVALLAPALNQSALLRYYYVQREQEGEEVTWENFSELLDEGRFDLIMSQGYTTKHYRISSGYFKENAGRDYTGLLAPYAERIMHIHGSADVKVPVAGVQFEAAERFVIDGADHDLERPGQMDFWLDKASQWLMG